MFSVGTVRISVEDYEKSFKNSICKECFDKKHISSDQKSYFWQPYNFCENCEKIVAKNTYIKSNL